MEENTKRRQSVFENVEKIGEKPGRRRSIFEKSNEISLEKENTNSYLEEWNERWGKYGTDFVKVVKHPEGYMQEIKAEKQTWMTGLKEMMEKAEEFGKQSDYVQIVEGCELSTNQKAILQDIDSKILQYIETCKSCLASLTVSETIHEYKCDHVRREIEDFRRLVVFKIK